MNDDYFDYFLLKFGTPTELVQATEEKIDNYRDVLPDKLLEYWKVVGFSGFQNGLFWITNPAEFEDVLEQFLDGTSFADYDNYYVIARSAYGELYLWGERTGFSLSIIPSLNWIKTSQGSEEDIQNGKSNEAVQSFFAVRKVNSIDESIESVPLFPSAIEKYGDIGKDEVIVFTPYLFMGGKKSPGNMTKENLHVYLQMMAEMGGAEIVDMASMVGNAIKHYGE